MTAHPKSPANQNASLWNQEYVGDDGSLWLQETLHWTGVYRGRANFLMADASVNTFADLDGDRLLNPGFPAEKGRAGYYRTATIELPVSGFSVDVY